MVLKHVLAATLCSRSPSSPRRRHRRLLFESVVVVCGIFRLSECGRTAAATHGVLVKKIVDELFEKNFVC
jgi:hypothetical protein